MSIVNQPIRWRLLNDPERHVIMKMVKGAVPDLSDLEDCSMEYIHRYLDTKLKETVGRVRERYLEMYRILFR